MYKYIYIYIDIYAYTNPVKVPKGDGPYLVKGSKKVITCYVQVL